MQDVTKRDTFFLIQLCLWLWWAKKNVQAERGDRQFLAQKFDFRSTFSCSSQGEKSVNWSSHVCNWWHSRRKKWTDCKKFSFFVDTCNGFFFTRFLSLVSGREREMHLTSCDVNFLIPHGIFCFVPLESQHFRSLLSVKRCNKNHKNALPLFLLHGKFLARGWRDNKFNFCCYCLLFLNIFHSVLSIKCCDDRHK